MSIALNRKGIPNPKEKQNSRTIPFRVRAPEAANNRAEPKNAPTQGVQATAKIIPNNREEKKFASSYFIRGCQILFNMGSLIIPIKFRPNIIIITPETKFTTVLNSLKRLPIVPANAPKMIKIIVNPAIKPIAFLTAVF
jgi:hypothetical protein